MLVTVITPCFNSEATIERTIKSVLNQTYKDIEYIIVDGASTDKTLDIIKKYESAFEGRMRIYSEPDDGIYYAFNKGIKYATGKIIGIVNSDDFYEEDAVEKIVKARTEDKYQIIYGLQRTWKDGKAVNIIMHNHENLPNQMITHPTCFVTKDLYNDKGGFDTQYRYSSDFAFMLRMYQDKEVVFTPVQEVISNYALGGASGTANAYFETIKVRHDFGYLDDKTYNKHMREKKIKKLLGII